MEIFKKFNLIELFLSKQVVKNKQLGITYEVIYVPPHLINNYNERRGK